ncbi:MAG: hypothetical protein AAF936_15790 [Pseudomonadota bacterium]
MAEKERISKFLISASIRKEETNRDGWAFSAPVRFNEDTITFKRFAIFKNSQPTLTVAITLAHLHYKLKDCILPEDGWAFDPPIETKRETQRNTTKSNKFEHEQSETRKNNNEAMGELNLKGGALSAKTLQEKANVDRSGKGGEHAVTDTFEKVLYYVSAAGSEISPRWSVQAPQDAMTIEPHYLKGVAFKDETFAYAKITGDDPVISIEAEIPARGIIIIDNEGTFATANKTKLGALMFKKKFAGKRFEISTKEVNKG